MRKLWHILMAAALIPLLTAGLSSPVEIDIFGGCRELPLILMAPLPAAALGGGGDPGEDEDDADAFILNGDEDAAEVRLLASDAGGFVIDLHLRGLKVEVAEIGGETFHVLTVSEKATTIEVGRPEIPVVSEVIAVPAGARIRATVIKSSFSAYPGYRVRPFQPPEVDCDPSEEARPFVIDEEFYSQDAFYPRELVIVGAPGTWRDLDVVELQINPVAFNPASGELRVYDHLRVRIDYEGATLEKRTAEPKFSRMYQDVILNYDTLDLVVAEAKASERKLPLIGDAGIDGPRASSDLVKYLSIRHEGQASYESVSPLLEMRAERGLPFVSYSFPSSSTPSAADVKEVIAAVYGSHPELEYVLIVGDIDRLPWNSDWGGFPGDYWYGCVAGDDLYPEVAVGRISAKDDGEVVAQVNKILGYEKRQPYGGWRPKVLLVAHAQDAPGKYQGCKGSIRTASYASPFVFETAYGADPAEGGDGATNADVMLAIDSGVGIVNYRGHGGYTYWGSGWNYAGESYGTAEAHALENGLMTPIIFSIACYNAALDHSGECLGEAFVKDYGSAVAFLGATRPSYTIENHDFDRYLFDAIGNEDIRDLGWAVNDANVELIAKYGSDSYAACNVKMYLLLGDPALEVRLEEPNYSPQTPSCPTGPDRGKIGLAYSYSASSTDPDGDWLSYTFDWGDGATSQTDFVDSGATAGLPHIWDRPGVYSVRVRAEDVYGASSQWSCAIEVTIAERVNRFVGSRRLPVS